MTDYLLGFALQFNNTLKTLTIQCEILIFQTKFISGVRILSSIEEIANALKINNSLNHLAIVGCDITNIDEIGIALKENKTLESLDLSCKILKASFNLFQIIK